MKAGEIIDKMREVMRTRNNSRKSAKSYIHWVKRFIVFVKARPAEETNEDKVVAFLTHLAAGLNCSVSTQKQAMNALVYLFKRVLRKELGDISAFVRANRPKYIPTVFSREEAHAILGKLDGDGLLWGKIMYGCGLRLAEVCALRVKDIDFERREIYVKGGKGKKDRNVPLPESLVIPLQRQIRKQQPVWEMYRDKRIPVSVPDALDRKYPRIPFEFGWFYLFPASGPVEARDTHWQDPAWIGKLHHIHESAVQKRIGRAIEAAGIMKRAGCHTFRHSFATHWLESAGSAQEVAIIRLQKLLGHNTPKTTMIYLHTIKHKSDVANPLDTLEAEFKHAA